MEENSVSGKKFKLNKKLSKIILALILLILIGAAVYFYMQYQNTKNLLQNPNQASSEEVKILLTQVGKLIELPTNEAPTIATVSDKTKLLDQPFFANAQNGDKVLIYANAKKAILYRPSINKIIEVAPVNLGQNQPAVVVSPIISPTVTPTVILSPKPTITSKLTPTPTP